LIGETFLEVVEVQGTRVQGRVDKGIQGYGCKCSENLEDEEAFQIPLEKNCYFDQFALHQVRDKRPIAHSLVALHSPPPLAAIRRRERFHSSRAPGKE